MRISPDRVSAGAAVGFICCESGERLWTGRSPALDHIEQVIDVCDAVVIDIVVAGIGYRVHEQQVFGINITIVIEVAGEVGGARIAETVKPLAEVFQAV